MTDKEIKQVKALCENEILIAIKRFEQLTERKVTHVNVGFKKVEGIGKVIFPKIFDRPK